MKITLTMAEVRRMVRAGAIGFRAKALIHGWDSGEQDIPVRFIREDGKSELNDSEISRVEMDL